MASPSSLRRCGVLIPVFSLRRSNDLGIGDTTALKGAIDWAKKYHIGFIQTLPIQETGSDHSPYNAISSMALDPLLLDLSALVELTDEDIAPYAASFEKKDTSLVDYPHTKQVKYALLKLAYQRFLESGQKPDAFEVFRQKNASWLDDYCAFRTLCTHADTENWELWSSDYNTPQKALDYLKKHRELDAQRHFFAWLQWQADIQWSDVAQYAEKQGVALMGDVPIGIAKSSADAFFEPQWFLPNAYGGSPPETVFKDDAFACQWGQNWGVPIYNWKALAEDNYGWWRRRVTGLCRFFQIFRIDHILGFYRIYRFPWPPSQNASFLGLSLQEAQQKTGGALPAFWPRNDDTDTHRQANCADGETYLKIILEAAGNSEVVGEDLGCVPDYVRPNMAKLGIAGFKICHWESCGEGIAVDGKTYPPVSFATYATHDHDSLPALWDLLIDLADKGEDKQGALRGLSLLSSFAKMPSGLQRNHYAPYNHVIKWSLLEALLSSNANLSALMITDLIDSKQRINIPGTSGGKNWRYRIPFSLKNPPQKVQKECNYLKHLIDKTQRYVHPDRNAQTAQRTHFS